MTEVATMDEVCFLSCTGLPGLQRKVAIRGVCRYLSVTLQADEA